jgi:hypothetical protein
MGGQRAGAAVGVEEEEMKNDIEAECPCTKVDCARHGDGVACREHHVNMPVASSCIRPETAVPEGLIERVEARLRGAKV